MIKILLGTASTQKIEIVKQYFNDKNIEAKIIPVGVNSGVNEQPLTETETILGSVNRAKLAINSNGGDDISFALGLEGGLELKDNLYYLICVATIIDTEGRNFTGISNLIPLPQDVSTGVKTDGEFGLLIREYDASTLNKNTETKELVYELINRTKSFSEAIDKAYQDYFKNQF